MELFLTSSVHAVAHDIAKRVKLSDGNKLVFIETAAEPDIQAGEDLEWLKNDKQALADAGFEVTDYTITDKTRERLERDLSSYDFIYMSGGDTAYLLEQSQKSDFITLIKELLGKGKIYIGTSAGSIIAGPKLPDYFPDEDGKLENNICYNLVNFTLVPHWGSEHFKERYLGERLKVVYKETQTPLLLMTDNQYVHVVDGQYSVVDLTK